MKDLKQYNTLKSLLTTDGNLNAALVRQPWFQQLPIVSEIYSKTACLDIFKEIRFSARFWFLHDNMQIKHCLKCHAPYVEFPKLQKNYRLCRHDSHFDKQKLLENRQKSYANNIEKICELASQNRLSLSDDVFKEKFDKLQLKSQNFQFLPSKSSIVFYADLIVRTSSVLQLDKYDLKLSERFYILQNQLTSIPKCEFCGKNDAFFINRIQGYHQTCNDIECRHKLTIQKIDKKYKKYADQHRANIDSVLDKTKYEVVSYPQLLNKEPLKIKCKKCQHASEFYLFNGRMNYLTMSTFYCKHCERKTSFIERCIAQFIIDECKIPYEECLENDRKLIQPLELDVYVPSKRIAIEVDGLYWHKDTNNNKIDYHLNKTEQCEKHGVQLIHIFENEWEHKQEIVKSKLKALFNIYDYVIYARKCVVKEIDSSICKPFLEENHLQSSSNGSVNLGLYFNDMLVSVMTFAKSRFSKKYEWEMLRFCSKLNCHVIGAAGKLLKHFENKWNPKSLVSYADRRWSQGKVYHSLNFKLDHASRPDYWYFDTQCRLISRIQCQKHKLAKILKTFDDNLTEVQNMLANGYNRIFDCGNLVFVKSYQTENGLID